MSARLVVLASGTGSTLGAVVAAAAAGDFPADVVAVGTDQPGCRAMVTAQELGVPTFAVALADFADRAAWNDAIRAELARHKPDLVVLAGFMRILAAEVVEQFAMVNTHPSLLPAFPGAHAVRDALAHGVKVTGVTIHLVDAGLDSGPILAQAPVEVRADDTETSLEARIQAVEKPLFIEVIREWSVQHRRGS